MSKFGITQDIIGNDSNTYLIHETEENLLEMPFDMF